MRIAACDTVVFLDYPTDLCLEGGRARRGKSRSDMPWVETGEDGEFIQYIKNFPIENRPQILEALEKYKDKNIYVFTSRSQEAEFLNQIRSDGMYSIYVKFLCLPGKREAYIQKMKETGILDAIRAENGCIRYDYYLSDQDPNEILLIEQWESKDHQQIHLTQPHMDKMREFKGAYITDTILGAFTLC